MFINFYCFGQQKFFYFHYTTDDGLPTNTIYAITESSKGIITLATDNGITFFNGKEFKNLNTEDGLNKPYVIAAEYDKKDNLYIGNYFGNLQVLSKTKLKTLPIACENISDVYVDNDTIYLKNYYNNTVKKTLDINYREYYKNRGVNKNLYFFKKTNEFNVINRLISKKNNSIIKVNNSKLIFENKTINIPRNIPTIFEAIKRKNDFILLTKNYIYSLSFKGKVNNKIALPLPLIKNYFRFSIITDKNENIWLNLQNRGLFLYKNKKWEKINSLLNLDDKQNINNVFCDSQGKIWLATHENGLFCIPDSNIIHYFSKSKQNFFNSFFIFNNELYTCNRWELLKVKENDLEKIFIHLNDEFQLNYLDGKPIFNISNLKLNNLNIYKNCKGYNCKSCLNLYDNKTLFIYFRDISICSTEKIKQNNSFIPTINTKPKAFGNEKIYSVIKNKNKLLFNIGSQLFWAKTEFDSLKIIAPFNYKPKGFVSDIIYKNDTLLLSENSKLHYLVNEKIVKTITHINGIKLDNINKIFLEKNNIWLATLNGLYKIGTKQNFVVNKYNYLPDNDVHSIHFFKNDIYVATKNGLAKITLSHLYKNKPSPKIIANKYMLDNQYFELKNSIIHLKNNNNYLRIFLSVTNFNSEKNQIIEYNIDNSKWNRITSTIIDFPSLVYGKHELNIRIKDLNSKWYYKKYKIIKEFPVYMKWWFILLIILLITYLLFLLYKNRIKKIELEKIKEIEQNKKIIELRQSALSAQMNPHFIFNSLNAIQYYINSNQKEKSSEYLGKFARLVRLFLNHASEPFITLDEEINRLKLYIELENIRFQDFNFQFIIDENINIKEIKIPNMIVQPFIENAILHGVSKLKEKDGQIIITINQDKDIITIIVLDNGYGIETNNPNSFSHSSKGLKIIEERLLILQKKYPNKIFSLNQQPQFPNMQRKGHKIILKITI